MAKCKYWVRYPYLGEYRKIESTSKAQVKLLAKVLKHLGHEEADIYRKCGKRTDRVNLDPRVRW